MADKVLVFYGSYRRDRVGIRMADFAVKELQARGDTPELIDARAVGLPIIDRMYKEYPPGDAPPAMGSSPARSARRTPSCSWWANTIGVRSPGSKNLTDHFLEEWFWRPAAVVSYSPGRLSGARASIGLASDPVRNGHGGDLQHRGGGADRRDLR